MFSQEWVRLVTHGYDVVRRAQDSEASAAVRGQCHAQLAGVLTGADDELTWLLDLLPWLEEIITDAAAYHRYLARQAASPPPATIDD